MPLLAMPLPPGTCVNTPPGGGVNTLFEHLLRGGVNTFEHLAKVAGLLTQAFEQRINVNRGALQWIAYE